MTLSLYLKQIEQLVALQKVDDHIYGIKAELKNAPQEVEGLQQRFDVLEEQRNRLLDKLTHLKEQENASAPRSRTIPCASRKASPSSCSWVTPRNTTP